MSNILYFLTVLLCIVFFAMSYFMTVLLCVGFSAVTYFAGYAYSKASEDRPIELKSIVPRKKKPPDPKAEAQLKEYNRQLYNIEHYTGSPDGMMRKGGEK